MVVPLCSCVLGARVVCAHVSACLRVVSCALFPEPFISMQATSGEGGGLEEEEAAAAPQADFSQICTFCAISLRSTPSVGFQSDLHLLSDSC